MPRRFFNRWDDHAHDKSESTEASAAVAFVNSDSRHAMFVGRGANSAGRELHPVSQRFFLGDGRELTREDKGRYQAENGEEFMSNDPTAP